MALPGDAVGCAVIEQLAGSSSLGPLGENEQEFQPLKNKDEDQNHVDHVSRSAEI